MFSVDPILHFFEFDPSYLAKQNRFKELFRPISVEIKSEPGCRQTYILTFMENPFRSSTFSKRKFYILTIQNEMDSDVRIIPLYISMTPSTTTTCEFDEYAVQGRPVGPYDVGPYKTCIEKFIKAHVVNRRSPTPFICGKRIEGAPIDDFVGGSLMPINSPFIPAMKNVYFTDPYTTVEWADGIKTTVKCKDGETFDKETGLAMCIAKRYFKKLDPEHPRKEFKKAIKNANDMSKRLAAKRAYKAEKKSKNQGPATEE